MQLRITTFSILALAFVVPAQAQFTVISTNYESGAAVQADSQETSFPSHESTGPWPSTSVFATETIDDSFNDGIFGIETAHADSSTSGIYNPVTGAFSLQASSNASTNADNGVASGTGLAEFSFTLTNTQTIDLSGSDFGLDTTDQLLEKSGLNYISIFHSTANTASFDQQFVLGPGEYHVQAYSASNAGYFDTFVGNDSGSTTFYGSFVPMAAPTPPSMFAFVAGLGVFIRKRRRGTKSN